MTCKDTEKNQMAEDCISTFSRCAITKFEMDVQTKMYYKV